MGSGYGGTFASGVIRIGGPPRSRHRLWRRWFLPQTGLVRNRRAGWPGPGSGRSCVDDSESTLRLGVDLTSNLQPIADLVTTDRSGCIHVLFSVDLAIVKSLFLQLLLDRLNGLIGPQRR